MRSRRGRTRFRALRYGEAGRDPLRLKAEPAIYEIPNSSSSPENAALSLCVAGCGPVGRNVATNSLHAQIPDGV